MPITIGSNIASMMAQRQLGAASNSYAQSLQRLSSGQRINTASDDAAGLAISSSLNTDGRVFTQAIRNLNDGLSLLAIADGAVEQLASIVTRQRELATQAANGTYGTKQRQALDTEAQALSREYFRIARTTSFNGMKLFDGSLGQVVLQGGYGTLGSVASSLGGKMGDGTFAAQTCFIVRNSPNSIAIADLNNDSVLDILTANETDNSLSLLMGNGDGTFRGTSPISVGGLPYLVDLSDVNNDGRLDVVVSNQTPGNVGVSIGNGDGTFQAQRHFSTGTEPEGLYLADFNRDGSLDIAVANASSNSVSILIGNGDASFRSQICFATGNGPQIVTAKDFNSDGILDLAVSNENSSDISILLGNGDGTFKAQVCLSVGLDTQSVFAVDVNGDGAIDLLSANFTTANISVLLGNGDGTFKAQSSYAAGPGATDIIGGDITGDGILDVITANQSSNNVSVLVGNGDGTFKAQASFPTGSAPAFVRLDDFNGDGVPDIVTTNFNSQNVSILLGNTRDGIGPQTAFSLATRSDALAAMTQFAGNLDRLSQQRATIGAFQSRISSAIATLMTTKENYAAAESRIKDTDVAFESSQGLRANILQQVATAVLAQANQQPTIALQLLRS
jgi:flagellin-like hook-associated protein FlgL